MYIYNGKILSMAGFLTNHTLKLIRFCGCLMVLLFCTHQVYAQQGTHTSNCYRLDSILTFNISTEDSIMENKEYFTTDSLCRTIKYVSYVWETDRYNTGQWVKEIMYTQQFDANDSLIEKISFEGRCINDDNELMEDRKYVWYRTKKEEWAYGNKPTKYNEYSVKEWNTKNKQWKLVQKDRTNWNEQGKVLCKVTRHIDLNFQPGWHFSKDEYTYDSTGKNIITKTDCNRSYLFPFWKKITGFNATNTFEAGGKILPIEWWCPRDTFVYNSLGKVAMHIHINGYGVPDFKEITTYENNGLTAYNYYTSFDYGQHKWPDSNRLNITTYDSLGNKLFVEKRSPDSSVFKMTMRWDEHHNKIYEEQQTRKKNVWEVTNKYTQHYTYDAKGRLLTDEFYGWPGENGSDSTLGATREYRYDSNGNTIYESAYGGHYEALYDDKGHILYKLAWVPI